MQIGEVEGRVGDGGGLKIPTLDFAVTWRMLARNHSDGVRASRAGLELRDGVCCTMSPPSGKPVEQTLGEAIDRWHTIDQPAPRSPNEMGVLYVGCGLGLQLKVRGWRGKPGEDDYEDAQSDGKEDYSSDKKDRPQWHCSGPTREIVVGRWSWARGVTSISRETSSSGH